MNDYPEWTLEGTRDRDGRDIHTEGPWLAPGERITVMTVEDHEHECQRIRAANQPSVQPPATSS